MKVDLAYIKINTETLSELLKKYEQAISDREKTFTVTPNLDIFRLAYKNIEFQNVINSSTFSTVDGKPILWIAKLLKQRQIKYKISGSDLAVSLLELMDKKGYSIFLFGGKEGVAKLAKEKIEEKYKNIVVKGYLTPSFGYDKDNLKCLEYIEIINSSQADFVFLCTGSPKTELFYKKYEEKFSASNYLSLGATIDFLAGNIKRAPKWMSNCGLEWLYRLIHDFRRLVKRYWLDGWFLLKLAFICLFNKKHFEKMK